jgi:hypothetical protein
VKRGGSLSFWRFSLLPLAKVKIVKNERDPPLFTGKLLTKFQNILRNITQVIIRHRIKILFSVISSPITLERKKWKSSKMKGIYQQLTGEERRIPFILTIFTFAVPELLDLIWRKIGFLPYVVILRNTTQVIVQHRICLQTDGHGETSIPPYNFVAGGIIT